MPGALARSLNSAGNGDRGRVSQFCPSVQDPIPATERHGDRFTESESERCHEATLPGMSSAPAEQDRLALEVNIQKVLAHHRKNG